MSGLSLIKEAKTIVKTGMKHGVIELTDGESQNFLYVA